MEKKKNSQVQAMDDEMLENVAGGKKKQKLKRWVCTKCTRFIDSSYCPTERCSCGGKFI